MSFLVIDAGSSSVRAIIFDPAYTPLVTAVRRHQFSTDRDGTSIADPGELRQLIEACVDEVLAAIPAHQPASLPIRMAGMAMFVGNLLGVDAAGNPITPIYTYADSRSAPDVEQLLHELDLPTVHQRTGCRIHPAYHPARLHWLKRTRPQLWHNVAQWLDLGTYLYRAWFGDPGVPCSYSTASWSGLLNRQQLTWDDPWLTRLELSPAQFPPLTDYTNVQQGLSPAYAERWPALREVPFLLAIGDGAAANVGSGAVSAGQVALTVGTTAALRVLSPELTTVPEGLWSYRLARDEHLTGGALTEGGSVLTWAKEVLALDSTALTSPDLSAELTHREADSHGLTVLPLLNGERAPGWNSAAVGTLHGLRAATTPTDILHALLESVANRLALIADRLKAAGLIDEHQPVYAAGGGLEAVEAWAQMICNALHQPLHLLAESESTARGVALLAARALDPHTDLHSFSTFVPRIRRSLQPQSNQVERLAIARARQVDLYHRLYDR